jgi:hypothetical protein
VVGHVKRGGGLVTGKTFRIPVRLVNHGARIDAVMAPRGRAVRRLGGRGLGGKAEQYRERQNDC